MLCLAKLKTSDLSISQSLIISVWFCRFGVCVCVCLCVSVSVVCE